MNPIYGGIEAGGTKFVCAVGTGPDDLRSEARFPTATPQETLPRVIAFFREQMQRVSLAALGIACFGPVDLDTTSATYGHTLSTIKSGWVNVDMVGVFRQALGVPVAIDTDVNGAALGEQRWGAAQQLDTFLYLTVGTGIGGGAMVAGRLVHGLLHPEMGHILVPHDLELDPFPGICPYHGDCLEGLAAGPALEARWGQPAPSLPPEHPAWDLEAHYLALGSVNYLCTFSPQRIVLGGGVMSQAQLFPLVRRKVQTLLGGYLQLPAILQEIDRYIVPPKLGTRAGVLGAMALAQTALSRF